MAELLLIVVAAATINNFVLERLLGLCPILGAGTRLDAVRGVSLATTGALTVAGGLSYLLDQWVLAPYGLPYLRIITFLALSVVSVRGMNLLLRGPASQLPLVTTNCAVLGVTLLAAGTSGSLAGALALGLGAGLGYGVVLLLLAGLRPRLEQAPVPEALRGPALALITVGIMSLAALGFTGFGA
ncbi:MAG: electron transport complex subunit RsxA [Chromatiales bacterium]|nr:electron transport complex subunit RsxA [Chromatiales bacterium]